MIFKEALAKLAGIFTKEELSDLNSHFKIAEFACKDGTPYPPEWIDDRLKPLIEQLEIIREKIGHPLIITSGYRTPVYNRKVAGVRGSLHIEGLAADIKCTKMPPHRVHKIISDLIDEGKIMDGGLGKYKTFTHYDIRTLIGRRRARWGK